VAVSLGAGIAGCADHSQRERTLSARSLFDRTLNAINPNPITALREALANRIRLLLTKQA